MPPDLPISREERLIWSSRPGGVTGYSTGVILLFVFGGMQALGGLMMLLILPDLTGGTLGTVVLTAAALVLGALWLRFRLRPAFFLSDRHLVRRRFLRKPEAIPLEKLRDVRRYVARYYTRYGVQEVTTHRLVLGFPDRADLLFGPVKDVTGLVDLLNYGVLTKHVELRALPSIDGSPAAAEVRTDLFFAKETASGGMLYGPLFLGPSRLIRFTDALPSPMDKQLMTMIAAPEEPAEIELAVQKLSRRSDAGHVTVVDLAETALRVDGVKMMVPLPKRVMEIEMTPRDAERAAKYLSQKRRAHPMR